jgi:FlaA1/EpsC-like NDP-sugar epimerase
LHPHFNLPAFISRITGRPTSLFERDIAAHADRLRHEISGKSVLVIGGAGTIGSSFVRAILPFEPARVFVVDTNENGLTELVRDVRSTDGLYVPSVFVTYPINFSQPVFAKFFAQQGSFDIVANFAAHKHVRSEKDLISIEAMVENNVLSARDLLELLRHRPPAHFFCVSTDKAANPVNVMGASKKMMEEVILAYANHFPATTARFANVAFSNGSLLFGFLERLMKRQPLSVPSDVKRFFVSPDESGQLCMLACVLGASGDVFFPKLDPERDLIGFRPIALDFLQAVGYQADVCASEQEARTKARQLTDQSTHYPVYFFESDTSGEKAYEEFFTDTETLDLTSFEELGVVKNLPRKSLADIDAMIGDMRAFFADESASKASLVDKIAEYVPTFEHIERGKGLDQKM